MSASAPLALHLAVNAAVAFAVTFALVLGVLRLVRIPPGRLRLAFLLLPWVKLGWDLGRGVPTTSFLWAHLSGLVRESGSLRIGVGATSTLGIHLRAVMTANIASDEYRLSLGDLAVLACDRLHPGLATTIVGALATVSIALLARRAFWALRLGRDRARVRRNGVLWNHSRVGWRTVPIFLCSDVGGSSPVPHAAGWLRPYVYFPAELFAAMTPAEREAALQHELAHIAQHHLVLRGLVDALACVFWFAPGVRALAHRICEQCEFMADDRAVGRDVDSAVLASALVKAMSRLQQAKPGSAATGGPAWGHSALGQSKPRLVSRVERLLRTPAAPAPRYRRRTAIVLRLMVFAITAQSVLLLVVGTNG